MSLTSFLVRRAFKKGDDIRDKGLTVPENIERRVGIVYGSNKDWNLLDVYRPKGTTEKLPVIVSIHGGGWTYGDKDRYQYYCMDLASRGYAVVNFTYRLAPEYKFPAGMEDTNQVFQWIFDNDEWFDLEHIYGVGDSAGGNMLSIYATMTGNEEYASAVGLTLPKTASDETFKFAAVGLHCGAYEIKTFGENAFTRALMRDLFTNKGQPEEIAMMCPVPFIKDYFPPAYVITANKDFLCGPPAQVGLVNRLKEIGCPHEDRTYGDAEKPLGHVFHLDIRSEAAKLCNDDVVAFFKKYE